MFGMSPLLLVFSLPLSPTSWGTICKVPYHSGASVLIWHNDSTETRHHFHHWSILPEHREPLWIDSTSQKWRTHESADHYQDDQDARTSFIWQLCSFWNVTVQYLSTEQKNSGCKLRRPHVSPLRISTACLSMHYIIKWN